jgi:hypothetical protein
MAISILKLFSRIGAGVDGEGAVLTEESADGDDRDRLPFRGPTLQYSVEYRPHRVR